MALKTQEYYNTPNYIRMKVSQTSAESTKGTLTFEVGVMQGIKVKSDDNNPQRYKSAYVSVYSDSSKTQMFYQSTVPGLNKEITSGAISWDWATVSGATFKYLTANQPMNLYVEARVEMLYSYPDTEEDPAHEFTRRYTIGGTFTTVYPAKIYPSIAVSTTSVYTGDSITITTSNGSWGPLTYSCNGHSGTITNMGNSSYKWWPDTATFAPWITNSRTATCTLSWNGMSKSITLNIPTAWDTRPDTPTFTTVPVPNPLDDDLLFLNRVTGVRVRSSSSAKLGARITSYRVTVDGKTYNGSDITSDMFSSEGNKVITVVAVDSRGIESQPATKTIIVQKYEYPKIEGFKAYRADSTATDAPEDPLGTYLVATATISFTYLDGMTQRTRTLAYRVKGASTWPQAQKHVTVTPHGTQLEPEYVQADGIASYKYWAGMSQSFVSLDPTLMYEVYISLADDFAETQTSIAVIGTGTVAIDIRSDRTGGGLGMYNQQAGQFDVGWPLAVWKGIQGPLDTQIRGGIQPVRYLASSDLSLSNPTEAEFIEAWLKWVAANHPNVTHGIFMGVGVMGSAGLIICDIYSTAPSNVSNGMPQYASGIFLKYATAGPVLAKFGVASYELKYNT